MAYAEGASRGAPQAVQVADRFHLVKNVSESVERLLERKAAVLRQAAKEAKDESSTAVVSSPGAEAVATPAEQLRRSEREKKQRRERRLARYEEVIRLYLQGCSQRQIARLTRLSRQTVQKYIGAGSFPETAHSLVRASRIDQFAEHIRRRWDEGCHQATELWREICEQGFTGAYSSLCQYVSRRYKAGAQGHRRRSGERAMPALSP